VVLAGLRGEKEGEKKVSFTQNRRMELGILRGEKKEGNSNKNRTNKREGEERRYATGLS